MTIETTYYDVLIIGSGAAGLALALSLCDRYHIALLSKNALMTGSSLRAQGGIAAVLNQSEDSYDAHIQDTLIAGAGLCHPLVVEHTVHQGKKAIDFLITHGVEFSVAPEAPHYPHLTQEGGHSYRRILHVADRTGAAVVKSLADQVLDHPMIHCYTNYTAIDLILAPSSACLGALAMHNETGKLQHFIAQKTVLATGGASACYRHTTNTEETSGDGIAMAWRAGCVLANLEFNQFHPTCLFHPNAEGFLISEAVRGEGGLLTLPNGERFAHRYHPRGELAPRDIVTRAIHQEMQKHGQDHVCLDLSHLDSLKIRHFFPTIYEHCQGLGLDITKEPIPVVPAAHYTCGGVRTDLWGRTSLPHLYAIGEVACTGLHGANRMASNSLLECLVFAKAASQDIRHSLGRLPHHPPPLPNPLEPRLPVNPLNHNTYQTAIRNLLWTHVGIVRNNALLNAAYAELSLWERTITQHYAKHQADLSSITCRNLVQVALLMARAALSRQESRGLHAHQDYPNTLPTPCDTLLFCEQVEQHPIKSTQDLMA